MDLNGAHVLITGASSGIGAHAARLLGERGARVSLFARRRGPLVSLQNHIVAHGGDAILVAGDVTSATDRARLLRDAGSAYGPVQILINNAGRADQGLTSALDPDTLQEMMDLNFRAPLALSQSVLPGMVAAGRGAIVNLLTHAVFHGFALTPGYVAAKCALHGATLNLRYELVGTGVRVVGVYPGLVDTEFASAMVPEGSSTSDLMTYLRHFRAGQRASAEFKRIERPTLPDVVAEAIVAGIQDDEAESIFPDDHHRTSAARMWAEPAWWRGEAEAFYGAFVPPLRELMADLMALARRNRSAF